ncbi:hypothetical protein Acr_00g0081450 [Actinidia rufa]|uniref:SKP1 component POZ domain-containing protein n=1 Tax=Actinidia rufa TaxID=165716 RepID=A0A7J0DUP3_9ERIC|nr:hypothetical protein Acr_00g0081450 [Actinidia rufa]
MDEEIFELEEAVAVESKTIEQILDILDMMNLTSNSIPLPNVTGKDHDES